MMMRTGSRHGHHKLARRCHRYSPPGVKVACDTSSALGPHLEHWHYLHESADADLLVQHLVASAFAMRSLPGRSGTCSSRRRAEAGCRSAAARAGVVKRCSCNAASVARSRHSTPRHLLVTRLLCTAADVQEWGSEQAQAAAASSHSTISDADSTQEQHPQPQQKHQGQQLQEQHEQLQQLEQGPQGLQDGINSPASCRGHKDNAHAPPVDPLPRTNVQAEPQPSQLAESSNQRGEVRYASQQVAEQHVTDARHAGQQGAEEQHEGQQGAEQQHEGQQGAEQQVAHAQHAEQQHANAQDTLQQHVQQQVAEQQGHLQQTGTVVGSPVVNRHNSKFSYYRWPATLPDRQRPAFLEEYPCPPGAAFNINSFLGRKDALQGKYFVPPEQYHQFLQQYFTAFEDGYLLYLTEVYGTQPYRFFLELDFDWDTDEDLVKSAFEDLLPVITDCIQEQYKLHTTPLMLVSMRTPYKVHLNFPSCLTMERQAMQCRASILEACREKLPQYEGKLDWEKIIDFPHGSFRLLGSRKTKVMTWGKEPDWVSDKAYYPVEYVEGVGWRPVALTFPRLKASSIRPTPAQLQKFESSPAYLDHIYQDLTQEKAYTPPTPPAAQVQKQQQQAQADKLQQWRQQALALVGRAAQLDPDWDPELWEALHLAARWPRSRSKGNEHSSNAMGGDGIADNNAVAVAPAGSGRVGVGQSAATAAEETVTKTAAESSSRAKAATAAEEFMAAADIAAGRPTGMAAATSPAGVVGVAEAGSSVGASGTMAAGTLAAGTSTAATSTAATSAAAMSAARIAGVADTASRAQERIQKERKVQERFQEEQAVLILALRSGHTGAMYIDAFKALHLTAKKTGQAMRELSRMRAQRDAVAQGDFEKLRVLQEEVRELQRQEGPSRAFLAAMLEKLIHLHSPQSDSAAARATHDSPAATGKAALGPATAAMQAASASASTSTPPISTAAGSAGNTVGSTTPLNPAAAAAPAGTTGVSAAPSPHGLLTPRRLAGTAGISGAPTAPSRTVSLPELVPPPVRPKLQLVRAVRPVVPNAEAQSKTGSASGSQVEGEDASTNQAETGNATDSEHQGGNAPTAAAGVSPTQGQLGSALTTQARAGTVPVTQAGILATSAAAMQPEKGQVSGTSAAQMESSGDQAKIGLSSGTPAQQSRLAGGTASEPPHDSSTQQAAVHSSTQQEDGSPAQQPELPAGELQDSGQAAIGSQCSQSETSAEQVQGSTAATITAPGHDRSEHDITASGHDRSALTTGRMKPLSPGMALWPSTAPTPVVIDKPSLLPRPPRPPAPPPAGSASPPRTLTTLPPVFPRTPQPFDIVNDRQKSKQTGGEGYGAVDATDTRSLLQQLQQTQQELAAAMRALQQVSPEAQNLAAQYAATIRQGRVPTPELVLRQQQVAQQVTQYSRQVQYLEQRCDMLKQQLQKPTQQ